VSGPPLGVFRAIRRAAPASLVVLALAGCGSGAPRHGGLTVVAAENFWGSIASQLAGERASVASIVVNPDTDPHSYDATPADARAFAGADLAIVNGIGYDDWAAKLLAANPLAGRVTVNVGDVLGLGAGANPHQWYSPASVVRVAHAIRAALTRLDPRDRDYFRAREHAFLTVALARYHAVIKMIRARYHGVAVGYSESIFEPLGNALGLRLLTPPGFAKAIAEGTDVNASDKRTVDRQAQSRQIRVWIFNAQNVTPDVQAVNELAAAAGIPIVIVTETLAPAGATFEQWQLRELSAIAAALARATGR
jgi:zinc/manganese transport system substrate-binding protein